MAAVVVMVYASGIYLTWGSLLGDAWETLNLSARPGEGFPTAFAMKGFAEAEPMGTGGFAAAIARVSPVFDQVAPMLLLEGLRRLYYSQTCPEGKGVGQ